jgi:serine/threonine-protein kinase
MSPEQAKGKPADKRSDIWAFGCVLFEMLTGKRVFDGEDVSEVLASVIKSEVNWDRFRRVQHPASETLVRRCLRKDPRQRFGDGGAVRLEVEEIVAAPPAATTKSRASRPFAMLVALSVSAMAIGALFVRLVLTPDKAVDSDPAFRLVVSLPPDAELVDGPSAVISPDAGRLAFVAARGGIPQLHVRDLTSFDSRVLPNTQGAQAPFFSPDGKWVAFFADGKLKKVSLTNGTVIPLADARPVIATGAWGDGDTIVFQGPAGLARMSAAGGQADRLTVRDQETSPVSSPSFLPGGRELIVSSGRPGGDTADERTIDLLTLATGDRRLLVQGGTRPQYLPSGHLVFFRRGALMAVPFDVQRLEVTGPPVEALSGVRTPFNGVGAFSCSTTATCLYIPGNTVSERTLVLVDRGGVARPLPAPPKNYTTPRFSPSGDRVLYWLEQGRCDIEIYDLSRSTTVRLTSEGDNHFPLWSADGQRVVYISRLRTPGYDGLIQATNSAAERETAPGVHSLPPDAMLSWSSEGTIAYSDGEDVWVVPAHGAREARRFAASRFKETLPTFSRDGRWLAYVSDESGRLDVYVQPFPGPGDKYLVSTAGGTEPLWAHSGRELFFRNGDQMLVADVHTAPSFSSGRPRVLFTGPYARTPHRVSFDVSPDDQNFLMLRSRDDEGRPTQINVMVNWFAALRRVFASQ